MSLEERRLPPWLDDEVCAFCPSRRYALGEFDVAAGPDRAWPWNPALGRRIDVTTGAGVCVHPLRVRLPVGRWASERRTPDPAGWNAPPAPAPGAEPAGLPKAAPPASPRQAPVPPEAAPAHGAKPARGTPPVHGTPPADEAPQAVTAPPSGTTPRRSVTAPTPARRSPERPAPHPSPASSASPVPPAPPLPGAEPPPGDAGLLVEWMRRELHRAPADALSDVLAAVERTACAEHPESVVVDALRRALA